MSSITITTDCNLGLSVCKNPKERNATFLCAEVDFAFEYGYLPYPMELLAHIISRSDAIIVRE